MATLKFPVVFLYKAIVEIAKLPAPEVLLFKVLIPIATL